jgi:hypothetical protein
MMVEIYGRQQYGAPDLFLSLERFYLRSTAGVAVAEREDSREPKRKIVDCVRVSLFEWQLFFLN